jgi:hypothetical protein
VTFTARVTSTSGGVPTGSVTFKNPGKTLGTGTLVNGIATFATSSLLIGTHSITATYEGDDSWNPSTSAALQQTVDTRETTTSLSDTPNPSTLGQTVTFTAQVTSKASRIPTGSVTFKNGNKTLGSGTLSKGVATFTTASLPMGTHSITASYDGGGKWDPSTSTTLVQTVGKRETATSLSATPNPSALGETVTFVARITSTSTGVPTGSVVFKIRNKTLGSGTLSQGVATFTTSSLSIGPHSITASYEGDDKWNASTSAALVQTVEKRGTTTSLSATPNPSTLRETVTFTARVASTSTGVPAGAVTFKNGNRTLGSGTLSNGVATFTTSSLSGGTHSITAAYEGNDKWSPSTSAALTQTVEKRETTTSLSTTPNPSIFGQAVTLTARVTSTSNGVPTGSVTFRRGGSTIATRPLDGSVATLSTTSLPAGTYRITAVYSGDNKFEASTSAPISQEVDKATTQTALTASTRSAQPGEPVTFTATVTSPADTAPTGTVIFKDRSKTLGTATLSAGTATFTTALTIGRHSVAASFHGGRNFTNSQSGIVAVTVDARLGPEFRVNSFTADSQQHPVVATLKNGSFIVAWQSNGQDGSRYGVYGQRYKRNGSPAGSEFRISGDIVNDQSMPAIAALPDGGFIVVWQSAATDSSGINVFGQRFNAAGAPLQGQFRISTATVGNHILPSVAATSDGGFAVVWALFQPDGIGLGIYGRRYDASSNSIGYEFQVSTTTGQPQTAPRVAGLTGGGFVVAWQSPGQEDASTGVYARRFFAPSQAPGDVFLVNTRVAGAQTAPALTGLSDGGFVVTWQSMNQDHSGLGVYGQRYAADGDPVGTEFRVNKTTAGDQWQPSVAASANGGFVVVWTSDDGDTSGQNVYVQAYDATGAITTSEFQVNTTKPDDQSQPSVATLADESMVVVWTSNLQDGSLAGVYGQRLQFDTDSPDAAAAMKSAAR